MEAISGKLAEWRLIRGRAGSKILKMFQILRGGGCEVEIWVGGVGVKSLPNIRNYHYYILFGHLWG